MVFRFKGYSQAFNPVFGLLEVGKKATEVILGYSPAEEKLIKDKGEYPEGVRFDADMSWRLAAQADWEAVNKPAKEMEKLYDQDHTTCVGEKASPSEEHMKYYHPGMYDAWKGKLGGK